MKKIALVFVSLMCVLALGADFPSLAGVQRIYIGDLGNNEDAQRFRAALAGELNRHGFTSVDSAPQADAVLQGRFAFTAYAAKLGGHATVTLVNRDGKEIWAVSVTDQIRPGKDSTQWVAEELAKRLKKQKQRDARTAKRN